MKFVLFIAQLFILLSRFKSKLIEKDDIRIINLEKEKNRIVKIIKEKVDIHIYASRTHVNIINKIVNKKYALNKLIELEDLKAKIYVIGDNDNDYEMLESFNGGVIKKHHKVLDGLNKKEYNTLGDYIEELMKN